MSGYVPVLKVDVQDTTGAGDAFLAGFLFGLMNVRTCAGWMQMASLQPCVRAPLPHNVAQPLRLLHCRLGLVAAPDRTHGRSCLLQAGGLDGLTGDEQKLRKAIEFAAATGGYTTTQLGGIAAQPTYQQAMDLLSKSEFATEE